MVCVVGYGGADYYSVVVTTEPTYIVISSYDDAADELDSCCGCCIVNVSHGNVVSASAGDPSHLCLP